MANQQQICAKAYSSFEDLVDEIIELEEKVSSLEDSLYEKESIISDLEQDVANLEDSIVS